MNETFASRALLIQSVNRSTGRMMTRPEFCAMRCMVGFRDFGRCAFSDRRQPTAMCQNVWRKNVDDISTVCSFASGFVEIVDRVDATIDGQPMPMTNRLHREIYLEIAKALLQALLTSCNWIGNRNYWIVSNIRKTIIFNDGMIERSSWCCVDDSVNWIADIADGAVALRRTRESKDGSCGHHRTRLGALLEEATHKHI